MSLLSSAASLLGGSSSNTSSVVDVATTVAQAKLYSVVIQQAAEGSGTPITVTAFVPDEFGFSVDAQYEAPFASAFTMDGKIGSVLSAFGMTPSSQAMTTQIWKGNSPIEFSLSLLFVAETDPIVDVINPVSTLLGLALPTQSSADSVWLNPPGPRLIFKNTVLQNKDITSSSTSTGSSGTTLSGSTASSTASSSAITLVSTNAAAVGSLLTKGASAGVDLAKTLASDAVNGNISKMVSDGVSAYNGMISSISKSIDVTRKTSVTIGNVLCFDSVVITNVAPNIKMLFDSAGQPMQVSVDVTFRTHQTPRAEDAKRYFTGLKAVATTTASTVSTKTGAASTASAAVKSAQDKFSLSGIVGAASAAVSSVTSTVSSLESKLSSTVSGLTGGVSSFVSAEASALTSSSTFASAKKFVSFGG